MAVAHRGFPDPIDEEIERLLADPEIRASLEDFEARLARGELGPGVSHEEARRIVGLPPRGSPST